MDQRRGLSGDWRLVLGVAVTVPLLAFATGAHANGVPTLRLLGGHSGPQVRACDLSPYWTYYRVGDTVRYSGHVPGHVARVKLVVRRCHGTVSRVVETMHARVTSTGAFKGSFAVNVQSDCFAQASYVGWHSNRAYFRVR
jgi:hypothetical protein